MAIEIRQTTVTTGEKTDSVQLHISDAPPEDASASFVLTLYAKVEAFETPALAHLQRAAMKRASDVLVRLVQESAAQLTADNYTLQPNLRKPKAEKVRQDDLKR